MTTKHKGPFTVDISQDSELQSTIISLLYESPDTPSRNINVGIAPELGSNMFRFRVGLHDLIYCEHELLKQKDFTGNFVLWPLPNRIRGKRYTYQGVEYSLAERTCPSGNWVLVHGLVFDRAWSYEPPVIKDDSVSVTTFVDMNWESPFFQSYPFESRLLLTYTLTRDGVTTTYQVQNRGDKTLPFGFALHPYFALLSGVENTAVSIPAKAVMEADDELLPTGRVLDVTSDMYTMFDLRESVTIDKLKLDHVYTELDPQVAAAIDYRTLNMQLHISATDDFTHAVIYTPPAPDRDHFFCLEHQTCSTDAINLYSQGEERRNMAHLLEVAPNESYTGSLHYTIVFK